MGYEIDFRAENGGAIKRLVWSTDLHFDAADRSQYQLFLDLVKANEPDCLLIGGDICNGASSLVYLTNLAKVIHKPVYFVLGNHDYYYGSINAIRKEAQSLNKELPKVNYLSNNKIISLAAEI